MCVVWCVIGREGERQRYREREVSDVVCRKVCIYLYMKD